MRLIFWVVAEVEQAAERTTALYAGTPRALLLIEGPLVQSPPPEVARSQLVFALSVQPAVLEAAHVVPPEYLVSAHEPIPGCSPPASPNAFPLAPLPTTAYFVDRLM